MKRGIISRFYKGKPNDDQVPVKRRRRGIGWFFVGAIKKICFAIGAVFLFSIFMGILAGSMLSGQSQPLPDQMILTLNVTDPIGETETSRSFADPFSSVGMTVQDLIATLDHAKDDARVKGLLVSLDIGGLQLAHIQEVREAVKRFRSTGKFAHIYTASFADLGSGMGAYYLATAFDEIWMQPVGFVSMSGISMDMPFAKDALGKLGVKAEFLHREEYKSAMESFTNSQMSAPNREMTTSLLDSISGQIEKDILADWDIKASAFNQNLNRGLITGKDALKAGLITKLDYADVLVDEAIKKAGGEDEGDMPLVFTEDYFDEAVKQRHSKSGSNVALVRISGEIVPGDEPEPGYATGDYIAGAIREATDDDDIKVIIVRVNSPGGSPTASETIRRAIVEAKEKGKKVVVSMGPVAASGGYWVAVDADKIYAMPSTLTGSIGVIMGKFELSGLWTKLGVNWDAVSWGDNSRLWASNKPVNANERAALESAIDDTYASFIERVAEGRKMDKTSVREVAKGRAWTGLQAKEIGLVDEIGSLDAAMDYAATLINVKNRKDMKVIELPKPLSPMEQILRLMGQQVSMGGYNVESLPAGLKTLAPYMRQMDVIERSGPIQAYDPELSVIHP